MDLLFIIRARIFNKNTYIYLIKKFIKYVPQLEQKCKFCKEKKVHLKVYLQYKMTKNFILNKRYNICLTIVSFLFLTTHIIYKYKNNNYSNTIGYILI